MIGPASIYSERWYFLNNGEITKSDEEPLSVGTVVNFAPESLVRFLAEEW